jgi:NAD-dependent deacetylase
MEKKKLIVFTGAGISVASGLSTFRDRDGLWNEEKVEDVATPTAWKRNPKKVLDFYNKYRKIIAEKEPNQAHLDLVKLEDKYDVTIITQNVDDLHERAGSKKVLHLHGEINKCRSSINPNLIYDIKEDLKIGDFAEDKSQMRPHVVWFDEQVPAMFYAGLTCKKAEIFVVIGSSMVVYPAANLIQIVYNQIPKYVIDPIKPNIFNAPDNITFIEKNAVEGVKELVEKLLK